MGFILNSQGCNHRRKIGFHQDHLGIISQTGDVDTTLALTQHGASSGFSGLDEIRAGLSRGLCLVCC